MSKIGNGGPAFPTEHTDTSGIYDGMTLRDYFAAKAMQAYMNDRNASWATDGAAEAAKASYRVADAMLAARDHSGDATEKAADDGWIEWHGGACPVGKGVRFVVRLRSGEECTGNVYPSWDWGQVGLESDIIAYRVVEGDAV